MLGDRFMHMCGLRRPMVLSALNCLGLAGPVTAASIQSWNHMTSYEINWTTWDQVRSEEIERNQVKPIGMAWNQFRPIEMTRRYMKPSKAKWNQLGFHPPNSSYPVLIGLININIYYGIRLRRALFIGYIGWLHPLPQAPPVTAGTGRAGLVELEGIGEGLDW